ncbi:MAG TPA: hypothetical protein V6C81_21230 [Planktothrix sp.]
MQTLATPPRIAATPLAERHLFAVTVILLVACFAILAGYTPIWFTLLTVCAFGAPHHWTELRYFMSRLPSRFGPLQGFFATAFSGALVLWVFEVILTRLYVQDVLPPAIAKVGLLAFNQTLIFWMLGLSVLRYKSKSNKVSSLLLANSPYAALATLANLLSAPGFSLAITYMHPLLGLWILERELRRTRKSWLRGYHWSLLSIPVALAALIWVLHGSGDAHPSGQLAGMLNGNVIGSKLFSNASTTMLLAIFGFLQMVHYGVWVIGIPIANQSWKRWNLDRIPVLTTKPSLRPFLLAAIGLSLSATLFFWFGFCIDYNTVNEIYIAVSMLHVLAEIPFIFWMCES